VYGAAPYCEHSLQSVPLTFSAKLPPSIAALENHVVQAGHDNFVVNSGNLKDMREMAAFNIACYVANTMVCSYRCMNDPQPGLDTWGGALIKHLTLQQN
jgi:hypothetical protein